MPKINDTYDVGKAFEAIEDELIASMIRNMKSHKVEEVGENKQWSMWQAEMLKTLERYKKENQRKYEKVFKDINKQIEALIAVAHDKGEMEQEIEILNAIKNGFQAGKINAGLYGEFFKLNKRKLEALIEATVHDMEKAEIAILRKANDDYRKIIFNAQMYANSGAGTYEKAVDMATKDMLAAGLTCIEYANGARHTLRDYADMAIRTASKRAYLQGEGAMRKEWSISTVIVNKRGNPCPKCLPFCGKVLIDDVWSDGNKDGISETTGLKYPLMSSAVAAGLYHPRCKDVHTTYFEGISTPPDDKYTREELDEIAEQYRKEQKQQYAKRQAKKFERLEKYSLDEDNKKNYKQKYQIWNQKLHRYSVTDDIKEHRTDTPEQMIELIDKYTSDEFVIINENAVNAFEYDSELDVVSINPSHLLYPYYDYRETMIHEIAHRIDQNEFGSPMHSEFSNAIADAGKRLLSNADHYRKMLAPGGILEYNYVISDIVGCITNNSIVGGASHDSQYIDIPGHTELEVFANLFSALYQGDDNTVEFIKNEFADVYKAFMRIIGERND